MAALKKSKFGDSFQKKLGILFSWLPLSPNQITLVALLFAIVGFYFASQQSPLYALICFMLAGAVDALDGAVARARRQVTARGAYIDGIIDRLVEFLFILSFFFYALPNFIIPAQLSLILLLFFGTCMTSFATAYAEHRHVADARKISRQPGILPRAERLILLFAALALVPALPLASSIILASGALLGMITFAQRFRYFAEN